MTCTATLSDTVMNYFGDALSTDERRCLAAKLNSAKYTARSVRNSLADRLDEAQHFMIDLAVNPASPPIVGASDVAQEVLDNLYDKWILASKLADEMSELAW